jgi:hypothetical protein
MTLASHNKSRAKRDMAENNITEPDPYKDEQALWSSYWQTWQSRGIEIDKLLAEWADRETQQLASPGAREEFHELCDHGCNRKVLAAIIALNRYSPRLETVWAMVVAPPEGRQKATRALENAAATLEAIFGSVIAAEDEKSKTAFANLGRISPSRMISELRLYIRLIQLAELLAVDTEAHSLDEVCKYVLSSYVERSTGRPHDRNVSGLIAEIATSSAYNEVAHRMWRNRHYERLDKHFSKLIEFLVAMSVVIARPA